MGLEEHSDDGHHCKSAVCQLGRKFFGFLLRVGRGQDLETKVSRRSRCARRLILGNLAECHVGQDLSPTCCRHLGNCCKSIWHVSKFQAGRWRQIPWQLSSDPWSNKVKKNYKNQDHQIIINLTSGKTCGFVLQLSHVMAKNNSCIVQVFKF